MQLQISQDIKKDGERKLSKEADQDQLAAVAEQTDYNGTLKTHVFMSQVLKLSLNSDRFTDHHKSMLQKAKHDKLIIQALFNTTTVKLLSITILQK